MEKQIGLKDFSSILRQLISINLKGINNLIDIF